MLRPKVLLEVWEWNGAWESKTHAQHRNYREEHTSEGVFLYEGAAEGLMSLDACKHLQDRREKHKWRERKNM